MAGLAAACFLADRGYATTVFERRPAPGGRAFSFRNPAAPFPAEIDNGQHVFLGCCTQLRAWLSRIGAERLALLQEPAAIPFLDSAGRLGWIRESPLPPPLHHLPSLLRFPLLSLSERLAVARALARLAAAGPREMEVWEETSFEALLASWGQSSAARRRFWEPIVVSAANARPASVSAATAAFVFRETLAGGRAAARVGVARAGLSDLLARPAARYIAARGGRVVARAPVARIETSGGRVTGVRLADGTVLPAARVVCALPWDGLLDVLPERWREDPFFVRARGLVPAPIVGIHLWLDRPVLALSFVGLVESPIHWIFNQNAFREASVGRPEGPSPPAAAQYLSLIVSDAGEWMALGRDAIVARAAGEVAHFLPEARAARVVAAAVFKERQATFRPAPGSRRFRLPAATPIEGLSLAGAWTDTGWPATLEGAVRSAEAAAAALG